MDRFLHEVCYPVKLFLKTGDKVGRAVLKKDDEAECEKHKEQEPEKTPDETHGRRLAYRLPAINESLGGVRVQFAGHPERSRGIP